MAGAVFFAGAPGGGSGGLGSLRESVPAPQIAFLRDQPLAGFQQRPQGSSFGPRDDADLVQPPREWSRRRDEPRERFDARRQSGVVRGIGPGPMRGRRRIGRGVQIVAERRAERRLIAFRNAALLG